jgi:hypothetical protein
VKIRSFVHKGLKALYAGDIAKGVPPDSVDMLRKMLAFLDDMQDRRLTFSIDVEGRELYDVNLEDYH